MDGAVMRNCGEEVEKVEKWSERGGFRDVEEVEVVVEWF